VRKGRAGAGRAVSRFCAWGEGRGLRDLHAIKPILVAAYIEQRAGARPTVKQHLSAIRFGVLGKNPLIVVASGPYWPDG
jgi:hypothetical protein